MEERRQPDSFFQHFWDGHSEVRRIYRLELGGMDPKLVLGDAAGYDRSGLQYLAGHLARLHTYLWYSPVRAIGFSYGRENKELRWNLDYNSEPGGNLGAPALLDSGSPSIRVRTNHYEDMLRRAFRSDCRRDDSIEGTSCKCKDASDVDKFPYISISFESVAATRFLGLDSGEDVKVCVPPWAYVSYNAKSRRCEVAIVDNGERQIYVSTDSLVLGVPFFRAVAVVLDHQKSRIGIGQPLMPEQDSGVLGGDRRLTAEECECADPKNWWSTGHRLSWRRVILVLVMVSCLAAYIFVAHPPSPTAGYLRMQAERLCGGQMASLSGGGNAPAQGGGLPGAGGRPDRPFVEMSNRRGQGWQE